MQLKCAQNSLAPCLRPPPPSPALTAQERNHAERSRSSRRSCSSVFLEECLRGGSVWFEPRSRLLEGPGSLSFTPIALARWRCNVLFAMPRDGDLLPPPVAPKTAG